MPYSEVQIANRALTHLGVNLISTTTLAGENTESARIMNLLFPHARDRLLRSHPWNFAMSRARLAKEAVTPAWRFDYQYIVPSDLIRLVEVSSDIDEHCPFPYRYESRRILTDVDTIIYITYVRRETDPSQFDPMFADTLSALLAVEAAEKLGATISEKQILDRDYRLTLQEAKAVDGRDDGSEAIPRGSWVEARS